MTHQAAYDLVVRHAPQQAGLLWNTALHRGSDTANAVADYYDDDEITDATAALKELATGTIPEGWERATQ